MSRIIATTLVAPNIVMEGTFPIPTAQVLSEGKQASSGVLLMQGEECFYITSNATDIKTTIAKISSIIEDLNSALTQIATTLTSIGAGMTGPTTAPPPTLAADVLAITGKVTELTATKVELDLLKEALK